MLSYEGRDSGQALAQESFEGNARVSGVYNTNLYYLIHNYSNLDAADLSFPTVCFQSFIPKHRTLASKKNQKLSNSPLLRFREGCSFPASRPFIWSMTTPREQLPSQPVEFFHHSSLAGYSVVPEPEPEPVVELLISSISMSHEDSLIK